MNISCTFCKNRQGKDAEQHKVKLSVGKYKEIKKVCCDGEFVDVKKALNCDKFISIVKPNKYKNTSIRTKYEPEGIAINRYMQISEKCWF